MTVYVGSTFRCPGAVADIMPPDSPSDEGGVREGRLVCWLMADSALELRTFAAERLDLPANRRLGLGAMMRYVITDWERNRALTLGARVRTFSPHAVR